MVDLYLSTKEPVSELHGVTPKSNRRTFTTGQNHRTLWLRESVCPRLSPLELCVCRRNKVRFLCVPYSVWWREFVQVQNEEFPHTTKVHPIPSPSVGIDPRTERLRLGGWRWGRSFRLGRVPSYVLPRESSHGLGPTTRCHRLLCLLCPRPVPCHLPGGSFHSRAVRV